MDDDGTVGTVTIGARDGSVLADARNRIELILNPPTAEIGVVYAGKVVNITKFGAFVNILPGRDGLLHISKLAPRGSRVEQVEDVLSLGQDVSVKVDDIDPQGKVSLSLAEPLVAGAEPAGAGRAGDGGRTVAPGGGASTGRPVSIEDALDAELEGEFGYLGPRDPAGGAPSGGGSSRGPGGQRGRRRQPGRGRR